MIETNICFKQILFPLEGKLMLIEAMFVTYATTLLFISKVYSPLELMLNVDTNEFLLHLLYYGNKIR
jgi:hypothetical protein